MQEPRLKKYLMDREKNEIRKEKKPVFLAIAFARILAIAGAFITIYKFVRHQIYSMLQPDYLAYGSSLIIFIALFIMLGRVKKAYEKRIIAPVVVEEQKKGEKAEIIGGELVLTSSDGKIQFDISRIYDLKSRDGRTSFSYKDPSGGVTTFSCIDYYDPQIARLLYNAGVR